MTKPIARDAIYRRRRFEAEIIELCVRWYITYRLSYRDLVAMMAERGLAVSHTTILRWVIRYVPEFEKRWGRWARDVHSSWRVDETYICVRGKRLSFARHWPPACRYLNDIVEQDHRAIKRRCASMLGFRSFGNAAITLAGIELAHRIHKRQFSFGSGRQWRNQSLRQLWDRALVSD